VAEGTNERIALMAIHPVYASAILDGVKKVEFRKRRPAEDIERVLIYATSPVQCIIGHFSIDEVVVGSPHSIWRRFGSQGAISKSEFFRYYGDAPQAIAIRVAETCRYELPIQLSQLDPEPSIPQSFSYLGQMALA